VLGSLAPICLVGIVFVRRFTPEPEPHGEPLHEHPPELDAAYRRLLRLFRVSIVTSYALVQALTPVLPHLMTQLELSDAAKPVLASVWMATRLATFLLLRSWHGWHGTRLTIAAAWVLMVAGFFVALLAPGVGVLVVGLAVLGVGGGIAYAGSIYYGLEVGATDVDAGGRHEASIGLGYAIGPLALLTLGASLGLLPSS
jgi:MFS family permease